MRDHLAIAPLSVLNVCTHHRLTSALLTPCAHARVQADFEQPRRAPEEDVPCVAPLGGGGSGGVERYPEDGVVCVCKPFRQACAELFPPDGELPRFDVEYLQGIIWEGEEQDRRVHGVEGECLGGAVERGKDTVVLKVKC